MKPDYCRVPINHEHQYNMHSSSVHTQSVVFFIWLTLATMHTTVQKQDFSTWLLTVHYPHTPQEHAARPLLYHTHSPSRLSKQRLIHCRRDVISAPAAVFATVSYSVVPVHLRLGPQHVALTSGNGHRQRDGYVYDYGPNGRGEYHHMMTVVVRMREFQVGVVYGHVHFVLKSCTHPELWRLFLWVAGE